MTRNNVDVLIAGGGFAGLTLAIALRQGLGTVVFGYGRRSGARRKLRPKTRRRRARLGDRRGGAALVRDDRRLGGRRRRDAQPILDMVVTDSRLGDAVRPTFLTFAGEVEPGEPFAHMIENRLLVDALAAKAREVGVALQPSAVAKVRARRQPRDRPRSSDGSGARAPGSSSPPTARARPFVPPPASPRMAGITASPPSSSMSRTSATTKGARRSIFCRPVRSRSCRSRAAAPRSCGPRRRPRRSASWRCPTMRSMPSSSSASSCISARSR